mmetsp:Transcript_35172/g.99173  ORF Transcript_35172/g.99173 Transcript_35172/m.99173 type:complete len:179 (+) Transcript_35172:47-583(+)
MAEKGEGVECILFCDIDGVLCCSPQSMYQLPGRRAWDSGPVEALQYLFREVPSLRMVLSSSWRAKRANREGVDRLLAEHDLPPLLGVTPRLSEEHAARGSEILHWLDSNGGARAFVAIDDGELIVSSCFGKGTEAHSRLEKAFVRTRKGEGLTLHHADTAIRMYRQQLQSDNHMGEES